MGYVVAARLHGHPLDLPYLAVGRTDGQAAVYLYPAEWDGVDGDLLLGFRFVRVAVNPDGTLKTYAGFPHGMLTPHAETINNDLLTFIQS